LNQFKSVLKNSNNSEVALFFLAGPLLFLPWLADTRRCPYHCGPQPSRRPCPPVSPSAPYVHALCGRPIWRFLSLSTPLIEPHSAACNSGPIEPRAPHHLVPPFFPPPPHVESAPVSSFSPALARNRRAPPLRLHLFTQDLPPKSTLTHSPPRVLASCPPLVIEAPPLVGI
jgi:hypothetical protein